MNTTLGYYESNVAAICARYEAAQIAQPQELLLSSLIGGMSVLELGCGSGRDGAFLTAGGYDWTGIDGSPAMVEQAKALHPELSGRIVCHDMREPLPFADNSFGSAFSFAALMHLAGNEVVRALTDLFRVLVVNAPLVVSVPAGRDDVDEKGFDSEGRYFLSWDESAWRGVMDIAGFEVDCCLQNSDGLGRTMVWLNFVARKRVEAEAS